MHAAGGCWARRWRGRAGGGAAAPPAQQQTPNRPFLVWQALEMSVLISIARADGKEVLDEALKEVGVTSVGHRRKIFAALQG